LAAAAASASALAFYSYNADYVDETKSSTA